jgi:hypothetical protein
MAFAGTAIVINASQIFARVKLLENVAMVWV